jgi:hypothetical protein
VQPGLRDLRERLVLMARRVRPVRPVQPALRERRVIPATLALRDLRERLDLKVLWESRVSRVPRGRLVLRARRVRPVRPVQPGLRENRVSRDLREK